MIVQRTAFVLGADQPADQVVACGALGAALRHHHLDHVVECLRGLHRRTARGRGFLGVDLRSSQNGQGPGGVLFDFLGAVLGEAD
ncbi:hypothetical protein D9M69_469730 [compost metagenome]